jgi:hypothetical protein
MENDKDKIHSFIKRCLERKIWIAGIFIFTAILLRLFHLRLRLWIWKILVVIIVIGLIAILIRFIFNIKKKNLRLLAIALAVMFFICGGEIMMLGGLVFFTQTEEVVTRDGEKYVMEVEQFDNTFVRFYSYKNLFFSGLISIEESYPEATIIYYDKNGREISDHLSTSENQEELWYLNNRMKY